MILGAGASKPYGFPLAYELRYVLLGNAWGFESRITELGHKLEEWQEVQELLRDFQRPAIDEFLGKYPQHAPLVKTAIAHVLNVHEQLTRLTTEQDDPWYLSLLDEHLGGDAALGGGVLTVVTFNYDLSLEAYLLRTLKVRHPASDERVVEGLRNLKIQHIYGDIGPLAELDPAGRKYGPFASAAVLQSAAQRISTCVEPQSTAAVAEAQRQIRESECVLFLGFGFAKENLDRLDLKSHLRPGTRVAATTVGVADAAQRLGPHLHPDVPFSNTAATPGDARATVNMLRALLAAVK